MATSSQPNGAPSNDQKATNPTSDSSSSSSSSSSGGFLSSIMPSSFKTPGTQGIEEAYSRAGGHNNHLPGHASKLGSQDQTVPSEHQGVGSQQFKEDISDQRTQPTAIGRAFNNMINGTDSTK